MLKLALKDIRVQFGEKHVLTGVDGVFYENQIYSIIGINGTGKSVLMKSIAGLQKCTGEISITDGTNTYSEKDIAYVSQMAYSTSALSAVEMVLLGRVRDLGWTVGDETIRAVNEMMERLDISHLATQKFSDLSGGEKQMVIMAQAFMAEPKVLLLDEPTSALDLYHQLKLLDVTREYCSEHNAIALVVMHDLSLVSRISNEILILHEGKALCQGTAAEVLKPEILEKVYRVEVDVSTSRKGFTTITPVKVSV